MKVRSVWNRSFDFCNTDKSWFDHENFVLFGWLARRRELILKFLTACEFRLQKLDCRGDDFVFSFFCCVSLIGTLVRMFSNIFDTKTKRCFSSVQSGLSKCTWWPGNLFIHEMTLRFPRERRNETTGLMEGTHLGSRSIHSGHPIYSHTPLH